MYGIGWTWMVHVCLCCSVRYYIDLVCYLLFLCTRIPQFTYKLDTDGIIKYCNLDRPLLHCIHSPNNNFISLGSVRGWSGILHPEHSDLRSRRLLSVPGIQELVISHRRASNAHQLYTESYLSFSLKEVLRTGRKHASPQTKSSLFPIDVHFPFT